MKKQATGIRRLLAVAGLIALPVFAWGCGQTAPTGVDVGSIQQQQAGQVPADTQPPIWH